FFFQAEDGIRDRTVTGVQTCALPISALPLYFLDPPLSVFFPHPFQECLPEQANPVLQPALALCEHGRPVEERRFPHFQSMLLKRSEERRVGKEGRSQWSRTQ